MAGYEKTCPALDPGENNVYIQYLFIYTCIYIAGMRMCINVKVTINIGKYKLSWHIYIYAYFFGASTK